MNIKIILYFFGIVYNVGRKRERMYRDRQFAAKKAPIETLL